MTNHIKVLEQTLQLLQQLTAPEVVEIERVKVELRKLEQQLQHPDSRNCSNEQLGCFLIALQHWLQQSKLKLEDEKLLLAESLRTVQKGRAGTQVYQTNR